LVDTFVLGDDDVKPAAARKTPARPPMPASTADEWEEF